MTYNYVCECKNKVVIENPINDPLPEVICEKCGKKMYQDFKEKFNKDSIIIPYNFKAAGERMYQYQKAYGKHSAHEKQLY